MCSAKISVVLGVLLFSPALASAQLRFVQPMADLGELRGGPVYQHRFEFVNESPHPLEITDIRLGCGCLQPVLDKRVYQPGEKGSLLMHVRTLGQPNGVRSWNARVQCLSGDKMQETVLILSAKIRNEVAIEPSIVALTVETALKQVITITDHRAEPLKIMAIQASTPALRVVTEVCGNGVTKVMLEVRRTDLQVDRQDAMLNIYADDPHYRHLQVPITLAKAKRAEVSATPDKVEIIGVGSQLVRLRGAGENRVRIDKAEANHPGIRCTWAAGPGNDATLKISVAASAREHSMPSVRVYLAEPAGATVTIPVVLRKE